jgi:hypothetical protein
VKRTVGKHHNVEQLVAVSFDLSGRDDPAGPQSALEFHRARVAGDTDQPSKLAKDLAKLVGVGDLRRF